MGLESTAASILCLWEIFFQQAWVDVPGQRLIAVTAIAVDGDAFQPLFICLHVGDLCVPPGVLWNSAQGKKQKAVEDKILNCLD